MRQAAVITERNARKQYATSLCNQAQRGFTLLIFYLKYQLLQNGVLIFASIHPVAELLMI